MNKESKNIDLDKDNNKHQTENHIHSVQKVAWVCTAIAICIGIVITKNPICLWAFVLPLFLQD